MRGNPTSGPQRSGKSLSLHRPRIAYDSRGIMHQRHHALTERRLRLHQELDACRFERSDGIACRLDHAGRTVDPEGIHRVAVLILG